MKFYSADLDVITDFLLLGSSTPFTSCVLFPPTLPRLQLPPSNSPVFFFSSSSPSSSSCAKLPTEYLSISWFVYSVDDRVSFKETASRSCFLLCRCKSGSMTLWQRRQLTRCSYPQVDHYYVGMVSLLLEDRRID